MTMKTNTQTKTNKPTTTKRAIRKKPHTLQGYTLLELLVVLSISTILAAFAAPSVSRTMDNLRADQTLTDLTTALALARSAAIQKDQYAVVCAEEIADQCGRDWTHGFMVFVDDNGNTKRDPEERVLQHFPASDPGSTITLKQFTSANSVTYQPDGSLKNYTAGSFTYCPGNPNNRNARHILINRVGRVRQALDLNKNGIAEDSNGNDVQCSNT